MIKLLILDGDDTIWKPLSGMACSDATPDDMVGNPNFGYAGVPGDADLVERSDGARFGLNPGVREIIAGAESRGMRLAVASWNHVGNVERMLAGFGLRDYFSQVVAEWHTDKASMIRKILGAEHLAGYDYEPREILFVDDDPQEIYRSQAAGLNINFAKMGHPEEAADWAAVEKLLQRL